MLAPRRNALILCVDDCESILTGWTMLLESDGYEVVTAADCSRAMQLFNSHAIDEVILDSELPEMSGDAIARHMKAIKPNVPILMLSGNDPLPQEKLKYVEAFLFKADSITILLALVKKLLNQHRPALNRFVSQERTTRADDSMDLGCGTQAKVA